MTSRIAVLVVILVAAAIGVQWVSRAESIPVRRSFAEFPLTVGGWEGTQDAPLDPQVMAILKVDDYLNRTYRRADGRPVSFYIGYFKSQRVGQTIHSPMVCLPGGGWQPNGTRRLALPVEFRSRGGQARRETIEINRMIVQNGEQRRQVVLYWYQSGVRVVASDYLAKVYKFTDAIRYNRTDGALVRVIVPVAEEPDGEQHAERLAIQFVQEMFPTLGPYIPS